MGNNKNNNQIDQHADNIKTINEFLIDLIGVLVPGSIFLFSTIISIIIPIIMIYYRNMTLQIAATSTTLDVHYATKWDLLASNVFNGWFWLVVFFLFLILSYALGNIFYRLDIKDVDKLSFKWQRKTLYKNKIRPFIDKNKWCRFKKIKDDRLEGFIKEYFELLFYHWKEHRKYLGIEKQNWMKQYEKFKGEKKEIIRILNAIAFLLYDKNYSDALNLVKKMVSNKSLSTVPTKKENLIIAKKFLSRFIKPENEKNSEFLAIGWYFLFYLRSEVACDNEEDCQFPYEHYDTYLLKRGELNLVEHTTWCKDKDSRTKNALNSIKLKIQLKSKEAYNILVKNEAHIRMASSSHRVVKLVWKIALCAIFISSGLLFPFEKFSYELIKCAIVISFMPISTLIVNIFIQQSVTKFLHYQRLREIFFVIQVYDELKKSKKKG